MSRLLPGLSRALGRRTLGAHPDVHGPAAREVVGGSGSTSTGRGWFAVQFGLFLALLARPFLQHVDAQLPARLLGLVLLAGGIVVAVAGYRALGSSHSPWTRPIDDGRPITTGIHARIRHLIYAGWCLGALGGEFLVGSILGVGVALAL